MTALLPHRHCRFAMPLFGGIGDTYLSDGLGSTYLLQVVLVDGVATLWLGAGEPGYAASSTQVADTQGFGHDLYVELVGGLPTIAVDPTQQAGTFQPLTLNGYAVTAVLVDGQYALSIERVYIPDPLLSTGGDTLEGAGGDSIYGAGGLG